MSQTRRAAIPGLGCPSTVQAVSGGSGVRDVDPAASAWAIMAGTLPEVTGSPDRAGAFAQSPMVAGPRTGRDPSAVCRAARVPGSGTLCDRIFFVVQSDC